MVIKGKITYKVDGNHPDIQDMPEKYWYGKEFSYEDTYTFGNDWGREEAILYMERDLKVIAGGGYSSRNIYDVKFDIKEVVE